MKNNCLFVIIFTLIISVLFSCILPFHNINLKALTYNNIEANRYKESELENDYTNTLKILNLSWHSSINNLMECNKVYKLIDIETKEVIEIIRIGGKNHADITPINKEYLKKLSVKYNQNKNSPFSPALLKLNSKSYLPCSLNLRANGYNSNLNHGHFCLYFKNSTTELKRRTESIHNKNISIAIKKGYGILNDIS